MKCWFVWQADDWSESESECQLPVARYEENLSVVEAYNDPCLQPAVIINKLTQAQYVNSCQIFNLKTKNLNCFATDCKHQKFRTASTMGTFKARLKSELLTVAYLTVYRHHHINGGCCTVFKPRPSTSDSLLVCMWL